MYNTTTDVPVRAFAAPNETTQIAQKDAVLAPRFYTTDFAAVDRLQITPENRQMWDDILAELRRDPNKDHFKRNADFEGDGRCDQSILGDGRERHPQFAADEIAASGGDLSGQPRLSDTAFAGDRHQTW